MSWKRMTRWLPTVVAAIALALPSAAVADTLPVVKLPTISGLPAVGETLLANAKTTGDPTPVSDYQWLQCEPADEAKCEPIPGATAASYVVPEMDAGHRLAVRVHAVNDAGDDRRRSKLTEVVTAAAGSIPEPQPTPEPDPVFGSPFAPAPLFLDPFPVVRIKGRVLAHGAHITLLRVKAPPKATVAVHCKGPGCSLRRRSVGGGRIARLERYLRAGVRITIRVSLGDHFGKYVRIAIRGGQKPKRIDACLFPGSTKAIACPPA